MASANAPKTGGTESKKRCSSDSGFSESEGKRCKMKDGNIGQVDKLKDTGPATDTMSKSNNKSQTTVCGNKFFMGVRAYILQAGIGKVRCELFQKQLSSYGGVFNKNLSSDTTHVIVDDKMDAERMCRILKISKPPKGVVLVKSLWLSKCLKEKKLIDTRAHELDVSELDFSDSDSSPSKSVISKDITKEPIPSTSEHVPHISLSSDTIAGSVGQTEPTEQKEETKLAKVGVMFRAYKKPADEVADNENDADSDYVESGDEEEQDKYTTLRDAERNDAQPDLVKRPLPKGNWVCSQASSSKKINHNKHITDKLEALAKMYGNTNDKWRALGYQKAVAALKRHPKTITSFEEAKSLTGVGEKLANKVWEIIESGELRKLNELSSNEDVKALELFTNIWGVGATTARVWVQQGLRTHDDVRNKATLTRQQKIGLRYYDELLDRMSREEAAQIEAVVKEAALSIQSGLIAMACGSYRRGKATCGDVDVLITHPDGKSHKGLFSKILNKLRESGFLTDDLVSQEDGGTQKKYLGVCKLPGDNTMHRRLDIIVVPYDEYACAVMYFTGSAHFNRSMRNLAVKMGMSLSEHSLNVGVVRVRGEKVNKGFPLPTPTEESVFKHLGLSYRPPEERDH